MCGPVPLELGVRKVRGREEGPFPRRFGEDQVLSLFSSSNPAQGLCQLRAGSAGESGSIAHMYLQSVLEQVTCPLWALVFLLCKMERIMNFLTGGSDDGACEFGAVATTGVVALERMWANTFSQLCQAHPGWSGLMPSAVLASPTWLSSSYLSTHWVSSPDSVSR